MNRRWHPLLLVCCFLPIYLLGQANLNADSLSAALDRASALWGTQPVEALELAEWALEKATELDLPDQQASANKILTRLYAEQGNYVAATQSGLAAIRLFEQKGDTKQVCRMLVYMGVLYRYQLQLDQSIDYYRQAEELAVTHDYDTLKASIWGNMGNVFHDQGDYDRALEYHQRSLEINTAFNNRQGMANSYHNIGLVYRIQKEYDKAIEYYEKSRIIDQEVGNLRNIGLSYLEFTALHIEMGEYEEALGYAEQTREIADQIASDRLRSQVLGYLPLIHASLGNTELALDYFHNYRDLSDSLQADALSQQIAEMQTRYGVDQQQKELDTQEAALKQQRWLIIGLLALLLPGLFIAYLLFNRYKLRQRNRQLQLENQQFRLSADLKEQQNLDQMKSRFFANISHEFRTPLNLILAPLEQERPAIPKAEIGMMRRNAQRLLRLVNQLLDLARIEGGLMKVEKRDLELASYISNIARAFLPLAESKNIHFQMDIPERDYIAAVDVDKLEKIIYNLLSNAFKFTPEGGKVTIHVAIEGGRLLRLSVSDTGIGIPEADRERIFERFYQVDESSTRAYEGTGIGLALIKELVDMQEGQISVDSQSGKGSTFTVIIPLEMKNGEHQEIAMESVLPELNAIYPEVGSAVSNELTTTDKPPVADLPLLLLVEDNADLRNYVSAQLADKFQLLVAVHGRQGLEMAREQVPDVIVTDVMMPEMDGLQLTKKLRSDQRTSHIPILLLTARDDGATKIKGFETGAEQYLVKPFGIDELTARVNSLLSQRDLLRQKFSREVVLQPESVSMNDHDAEFLQELIGIIEENIENESFTVEYLQREIGMSRMQLHRKLKALVNQSASEFIRSIKLKRAAQILLQPGIQITEAAYQSGFNHLSYFAKCFKEQYGLSPSEYRTANEN
ncbi:tetratricopeptide repeat protein [Flavilitoribacter nigricans]|uniref:histidine kinase n=1 Tax=Flavilitoribacter nigricans (strain ATCC 23147 / DSM 23189 / NBRC 102662 / NCIMB 1420 / SS-2) TaxID=1122177 RepID=A0A2D0NC70_FLAN2|nr:tetratricopeptide repeat protein [Flavilitoribacter nigricans]PHN06104.1 hypothetical protein CRP01_14145 [Flavilitoribacter nigricans DSM 23189 = NBRC 102662]